SSASARWRWRGRPASTRRIGSSRARTSTCPAGRKPVRACRSPTWDEARPASRTSSRPPSPPVASPAGDRDDSFRRVRPGHIEPMILHVIGLIVVGLIVGALGRLIHPGRDPMGLAMTIVIGVASVVIAGLLIGGWLGFVLAVIIGVVLV